MASFVYADDKCPVCPPEDVYVLYENDETGEQTLILIPKGALNNPDFFFTKEEAKELLKHINKQRQKKAGAVSI